jgi:hypothetical protein
MCLILWLVLECRQFMLIFVEKLMVTCGEHVMEIKTVVIFKCAFQTLQQKKNLLLHILSSAFHIA